MPSELFQTSKLSKNATEQSIISCNTIDLKAKSAPIPPLVVSHDVDLKKQTSAPSYLLSLGDNGAAPFVKPGKPLFPAIVIDTVMTADDAIAMVGAAADDELEKYLGKFLVEKNIILNYNLCERDFLIRLMKEAMRHAAQHDFSSFKLACLVSIYIRTHLFFKWYYWQPPSDIWAYFKEVLVRHTIEDSPDGQEVFEPEESFDILTHFHTIYLSNLPLIHILCFGVHRLKFLWPLKGH